MVDTREREGCSFFFALGGSVVTVIDLFSTNRKKILNSNRYYLRTKLEPPSTARRYIPGDLIFVNYNLPSIHFN